MSIIFGIVEGSTVVLAGDKRGTLKDGNIVTDNMQKVIVVNRHLAFASAGNASIGEIIARDVQKSTRIDVMTTVELNELIRKRYQEIIDKNITSLLNMPFYHLIAGKNINGHASLISGGFINRELQAKDVPMAMFSPDDVNRDVCDNIFAKNYKLHHDAFVEKTIKEIASMSKLVSKSGDKWIYSNHCEKGTFIPFVAE